MNVRILTWDSEKKELDSEPVDLEGELWPGDECYGQSEKFTAEKWHKKIFGNDIEQASIKNKL